MIPEAERVTINWVLEQVGIAEEFLKGQVGFDKIDRGINYIQGNQIDGLRNDSISQFSTNMVGKVVTDLVASLSDIKPFLNFKTHNEEFKQQAGILNRLAHSWWINNFIDVKIGMGLQLAAPVGLSYLHVVWNPLANGGVGDVDIIPRDARNVLPIQPSKSLDRDWETCR